MKATRLLDRRLPIADGCFAQIIVWALPQPLPGSAHTYKYRLAYVVQGECVVRYDNERGKGDHKHVGARERPYAFTGLQALLDDFQLDIERFNHENGIA